MMQIGCYNKTSGIGWPKPRLASSLFVLRVPALGTWPYLPSLHAFK